MANRWGDKPRAKQMETNHAIYFYVDYFVFPPPLFSVIIYADATRLRKLFQY